jgi:peptidoglycan hydrolase-like protein with peptidoglycan-binding domain
LVQTGEGSAGQETTKYGSLTKQAVIKFQEANFDAILKPLNLTKGTGLFYDSTRNFVNDLLK